MLEIRHLRMIDAIARTGTVTAAARGLDLSQPAVSHALAELEARLGVRLFHREPRGMTPTREGDRLARAAAAVLPEIERAETDVERLRRGHGMTLRVGVEDASCYGWLGLSLEVYKLEHPDIVLEIVPVPSEAGPRAVGADACDLAIAVDPEPDPNLAIRPILRERLGVGLPVDHRLAGRDRVDTSDLRDELLFLPVDARPPFESGAKSRAPGVQQEPHIERCEAADAIAAVAAGLGVAVMAVGTLDGLADPAESDGWVRRPLDGPGSEREWAAVTRVRDTGIGPLDALIDALQVAPGRAGA